MWRLCLEDDQQNRTVVNLVRQSYTIGRAEENAIRLTERNISRKHAILERSDDGWLLKDLDSYTGCFVNEQRVDKQQFISHGDKIRLGDYSITLTDEARQDETVRATPGDTTIEADGPDEFHPEQQDRLVVIEGPNVGASYPLTDKRMLIGRGEECDIALNDTSVSRVHADVERLEDGRYRITDQESSNGVRINGVELPSVLLDIGDVVELGDVFLKFVPKGVSYDPKLSRPPSTAPVATSQTTAQKWLQRLTSNPRLLAYTAAGGLVLGVLIFSLAGSGSDEAEPARSPAELALQQASRLFEQGRLQAAHEKLEAVAPSSSARHSTAFRRIQAAWADALLERAEKTESEEEERRLLSLIARSQSVDALRRRRAAERLEQLNAANMRPTDLPPVGSKPDAGTDGDFKVVETSQRGTKAVNDEQAAEPSKPKTRVTQAEAAPRPQSTAKPKAEPTAPTPTHEPKPTTKSIPKEQEKQEEPAPETGSERLKDPNAVPVRQFPGDE